MGLANLHKFPTRSDVAPRLLCLATHHKGGTVWMKRVAIGIARELGVPWIGIWGPDQLTKIPTQGRAILVNWHGTFPQELWDNPEARFVHIIRDPRDILLSGCQYHHHAGPKGEAFLHKKRSDLGGLTYQQWLLQTPDLHQKLLFEMGEKHADTVAEMMAWPYDHPHSLTLKYEDLMQDIQGVQFTQALAHWGLTSHEQARGRAIFVKNSLFSSAPETEFRQNHIQSQKITRWHSELPPSTAKTYARTFGTALAHLGYEPVESGSKNLDIVRYTQSPYSACQVNRDF